MVLVLGGNGFIGYNLVKRLARREKIRVFDRSWKHEKDSSNVEVLLGNFCDADFEALLKEVDTVFHFISSSVPFDGTDGMVQDIEDNLLPTIRFLDVAKRKEVKKVIFICPVELYMENVINLPRRMIDYHQNVFMQHRRYG